MTKKSRLLIGCGDGTARSYPNELRAIRASYTLYQMNIDTYQSELFTIDSSDKPWDKLVLSGAILDCGSIQFIILYNSQGILKISLNKGLLFIFDAESPNAPLIELRIVTSRHSSNGDPRTVTIFDSIFCSFGLISQGDWSLVSIADVADYLKS